MLARSSARHLVFSYVEVGVSSNTSADGCGGFRARAGRAARACCGRLDVREPGSAGADGDELHGACFCDVDGKTLSDCARMLGDMERDQQRPAVQQQQDHRRD